MSVTDYEQEVLSHYKLSTPFPLEWPADKDGSDAEDDGISKPKSRRKSRYSALERPTSPAANPGDGPDNLAQSDEPDPLGAADSVVRLLRRRGLPVEEDLRLRNQFLISSKTFSPSLFLSEVHSTASTQSLLQGLEFLSRSIDQKSAALKALVEANFERFVKAKSTLDEVYTEMRNQGDLHEPEAPQGHSRQTSKSSGHFRGAAGSNPPGSPGKAARKSVAPAPRRNALTQETEYGVQGIRIPLMEVSARAQEVWGAALGGREREGSIEAVLTSVEKYRGVFEVGETIADCIKRRDYEALVEEYGRARRFADEARETASTARQTNGALTDAQVHQIIVTARMWVDVEEQVDAFRLEMWRKLADLDSNAHGFTGDSADAQSDEHTEYVSILLELGTQENPIWAWLLQRYEHLRRKITAACERLMAETEFVRRHLATDEKPSARVAASHLRPADHGAAKDAAGAMDTVNVVELWERILLTLQQLLASRGSVLAEVIGFWETAQSYIDGRAQRTLPVGFDGQSRKHHRMSPENVRDLQRGAAELVGLIRENVHAFFGAQPIEDLSSLYSPATPIPRSPGAFSPRAFTDSRFNLNLDLKSPPPPSPQRGEAWEKYAFWPPHSNSLSGVHYLGKMLVLVGTAASEMAGMGSIGQASSMLEPLRMLVADTRERSVQAICAAWNQDADNCKALEEWKREIERKELTTMPSRFIAFESAVLSGLQKIVYISEATSKPGSAEVISPPPAKVLQLVRNQFVASLYKAFSGMVENAERPPKASDEQWGNEADGLASPATNVAPTHLTAQSVNAQDQNVRILLTLSNLQATRAETVPQLVTQFENAFSVKLTDESKTIHDVLGQIETRLFQSYTRPIVDELGQIVHDGILAPTWVPKGSRPSEVRPYVYKAMLRLVLVHTQIGTTAPSLTGQLLSYLLEQLSMGLLHAFKQRPKYTLAALMQATLDVEFVTQTLSQYATDKASEVQSQIYLEIDRVTDNEARRMLQNELPEMRTILKVLRDSSKAEFACFKRQRSRRSGGGQQSDGAPRK
ncbi:MAG: hypothetical protein M1832_001391 [Thelocarpon impressellum]|nr:MAG: hypothetical protein M1832_001391 [Thelocarpon impressellum]